MASVEFSLWLTPREPLRSALRSTIGELAASVDAVAFEPHVTVFCAPSTDTEARAAVARIARRFAPVELIATGLGHTDRFTKTLFVQFEDSPVLRQMFELAKQSFAAHSNYVLNPHLSLLYKTLPAARRQALSETLAFPAGPYWFDRIRMIETELPIEDAGPVQRWRMVYEADLTAS